MDYTLDVTRYPAEAGTRKPLETKIKVRDKLHVLLGFTLIESLVVFAVVGILSGIMFSRFHGSEQSAQLDFDADTFLGSLYEVRAWSLAGQRTAGIRPHGGYGVEVPLCATPPCQYTVFADTYPPVSVSPNPPTAPNYAYDPGQDEVVAVRVFSKSVTVASVAPTSPSTIVFSIPTGSVYINGAQTASEFLVELQHITNQAKRRVRVDRATGRMNFE